MSDTHDTSKAQALFKAAEEQRTRATAQEPNAANQDNTTALIIQLRKELAEVHKNKDSDMVALTFGLSILVFGFAAIWQMNQMMKRLRFTDVTPLALLRPFAIVLIIVAAVFLVVAGFSLEQISPVVGLLGSIAGYLLGAQHNSSVQTSGSLEPEPDAQPGSKPPPASAN